MQAMTQYPRWFLPTLLAVLLAVFATGLMLVPTTLAVRAEWDVPWRLGGGSRVWIAAAHSAAAFGIASLVGALWSVHMRSGWRRRRQRSSGLLLGSSMAVLALTAVGVFYLGDERLAAGAAYSHLGLGLLALPTFLWHWLKGRAAMDRQLDAARHRPRGKHGRP